MTPVQRRNASDVKWATLNGARFRRPCGRSDVYVASRQRQHDVHAYGKLHVGSAATGQAIHRRPAAFFECQGRQ